MDPVIVLDGFHAWKHAVRFGAQIISALSDDPDQLDGLIADLAPDLADARRSVMFVDPAQLTVACARHGIARPHHTGVMALACRPSVHAPGRARADRGALPAVLVDRARNAGNLGAVVRVAAAAGASALLSTGTLDPWHRDVVRAAAGLHWALGVDRVADGDEASVEGPIVLLDPMGEDIATADVPPGAVIVVGAERAGVSPVWRQRADLCVALPMRPGVSSLNLATTVSAALYHLMLTSGAARR